MKNKVVVALIGKSGAGKDTILKKITPFLAATPIISCTTRPPRQGEINHINYHFLTKEDFLNNKNQMLEFVEFNGWYYGTRITDLYDNEINIGVFNPEGIEILRKKGGITVIPVYVTASNKIRLKRILDREKNPDCAEICRRFFTDEKDFNNIGEDYNYIEFINEKRLTKRKLKKLANTIKDEINKYYWARFDNNM